jgi:KUP system potassium uptake protein
MMLAVLGVFGASLFFGDSVITPAISVLSAVEGVKVAAPSAGRPGRSDHGRDHQSACSCSAVRHRRRGAPVRAGHGVWFAAIGAIGVHGIAAHPGILKALSPTYALGFLIGPFLDRVLLADRRRSRRHRSRALYADMGHFGRAPITRRVWLFLVFPACILSYMGQGALVLGDPSSISSPFFLLVPGWARLPMVLPRRRGDGHRLAGGHHGAFSVAQQAARIGYLPRLRITYTSEERIGQIYVPWINWILLVSVLTLVVTFRTSAALAYAYGMAVTGTITITTLLFLYVARYQWHTPLWILLPGGGALLAVELSSSPPT